MRKYELILAFILAMILMFLASCRSKEVVINEQVDSVSVREFSLADIRSQMLDFSFDSMEIVADTVGGGKLLDISYKLKIKGGRVRAESLESRAERSEKRDSVKVKSVYHEERRMEASKSRGVVIILICFIVFVIGMVVGRKLIKVI